jgi:type II/III secretion system protein
MRIFIICLGLMSATPTSGQGLEIIPLRHRTVEQVLPVLRPLVEPGGTLSGHSNQIFLRASPANVAEIRRALESIDRPLRRLQISVRFDDAAQASRQEIGAGGQISNRGARIDIGVQDSQVRSAERIDQRLQLLEGGRGVIFAGQSRELVDRATGFVVVPRLAGDTVHVDIAPQREVGDNFQRAATTVSARLGEWFEIGGAGESAVRDERGILSVRRSSTSAERRIWLKVEEVRP